MEPDKETNVTTFAPMAPTTYVPPTLIAPETYVIHQVQPALGQPLYVYLNSMVIRGREPIIVDTGTPANREQWLTDVFSLVEPADVRWVLHEESFDIGDRTLHAVRPPVYDSPTTRGLFAPETGVYWAVDTFATPLPDPTMAIADLDPGFWQFGMTLFA